jgi:hypothetical protein
LIKEFFRKIDRILKPRKDPTKELKMNKGMNPNKVAFCPSMRVAIGYESSTPRIPVPITSPGRLYISFLSSYIEGRLAMLQLYCLEKQKWILSPLHFLIRRYRRPEQQHSRALKELPIKHL